MTKYTDDFGNEFVKYGYDPLTDLGDYTDENGQVWSRPTAYAYAQVCKANDSKRDLIRILSEDKDLRYRGCLKLGSHYGEMLAYAKAHPFRNLWNWIKNVVVVGK